MRSLITAPSATEVLPQPASRTAPPVWLIVSAFAAVYLIWGSTYLGIRIAIDSIPPLLMAGSRFTIAGLCLYVVMRLRGEARPQPQHWIGATIIGGLLILAGNGGVSWAQQFVPSGITALMVAAVPLWMMLVDWLRPAGRRPTVVILLGLCIGFAGVMLMVLSRNSLGNHLVHPLGAIVLLFATLAWALGSIYSRHAAKPDSAILAIAMQMFAGGVLEILVGLTLGEAHQFHPTQITRASALAFVYLTFIGSLVGFTAYVWLLQVCSPAKVSSYAYVNPVIAVILGHLILNEPFAQSLVLPAVLILVAVYLLTRRS